MGANSDEEGAAYLSHLFPASTQANTATQLPGRERPRKQGHPLHSPAAPCSTCPDTVGCELGREQGGRAQSADRLMPGQQPLGPVSPVPSQQLHPQTFTRGKGSLGDRSV